MLHNYYLYELTAGEPKWGSVGGEMRSIGSNRTVNNETVLCRRPCCISVGVSKLLRRAVSDLHGKEKGRTNCL